MLIAVRYKIFLAQQEQQQYQLSFPLQEVAPIAEEIRVEISRVSQFPTLLGCIIDTLGAVVSGKQSYIPIIPEQAAAADWLYYLTHLSIDTLREFVEGASNAGVGAVLRNQMQQFNAIPGADYHQEEDESWLLLNPDDIIPEGYGIGQVRADIAPFQQLVRTMRPVMPRGFFTVIDWTGIGCEGMLVSC